MVMPCVLVFRCMSSQFKWAGSCATRMRNEKKRKKVVENKKMKNKKREQKQMEKEEDEKRMMDEDGEFYIEIRLIEVW